MSYESVTHDEHLPSPQGHRDYPRGGNRAGYQSGRSEALQRGMDLLIAIPMLIFLLPVFGLIAVVVMFDSPGPVIFRHTRRGRGGEPFRCRKFRTMVADAELRLDELLANDEDARREWERTQKLRDDPRVTRVGAFLRKTSLDELPQLWNIIRGEMSIVGPRPIIANEVVRYGDRIVYYDAVRPGVVGLWQISGRNDTTYEERVQLDVDYARNCSLLKDIGILLRSIPAILFKRGAY